MKNPFFILSDNLVDLTEKRQLTPEQCLKVEVLTRLLGEDQVEGVLEEGRSIDQLFTRTAEVVYCQKRRGPLY